MIAQTHRGRWHGPNRLWLDDPAKTPADTSDGSIDATAGCISYTWSRNEKAHHGKLELFGPEGAAGARWRDTFHSDSETVLHGFLHEGVVKLFGTYPAGDDTHWGWRIELDLRDPDAFVLRMFNVPPEQAPVPAVVLHGRRQ